MATDEAKEQAVQLLYDNLAALPSKEHGPINMLPFAHDSEITRGVKKMVCEALVDLLDGSGLLKHEVPQAEALRTHEAMIECQICRKPLVHMITTSDGIMVVDARTFIGTIAGLNPRCPHGALTADDMRQHMQDEFYKAEAEDEAAS